MCLNLIINLVVNQLLRVKHITASILKWRVFRRFWIYLLMSFVIVLIQIILCVNFYSSINSSIESKFQSQLNLNEKFKRNNPKAEPSVDLVSDNSLSTTNSFDASSGRLQKYRDMRWMCNVTAKDDKYGLSAIERAVSRECKQQLADITCLAHTSHLYPSSLPRYCPLKDGDFGDYVGCYRDNGRPRLLSGYKTHFSDNSPEKCLNVCLQSGFTFAGLLSGDQCFCGSEISPHSQKLEQTVCDVPCVGSDRSCGGLNAVDVYKTGLKFIPKVVPTVVNANQANGDNTRIVFLLTLNGRSLRQIKRLFKLIYRPKHYYYIHIDSRQDYLFRELSHLETLYPNVRLSTVRLSTIWGGASLLQMLLNSISQIMDFKDWNNDWDFVINLSESDFPLKPIEELEKFLASNKGRNFVKSHGQDAQRFITKQGLDKTFFECDTHMWRIGDRRLPSGVRWDGGSDWVVLSRDFCQYITLKDNELLRGLKKIFKYTLLPAESFFHTVLQNSEFCWSVVDSNLRLTNWRRKQGCKCQYKHIVDWCGCSPNDFRPSDWSRIIATQTKPLFFARKFEPIVNQNVINRLNEMVDKNFSQNIKSVDSYWQNDYHFRDRKERTEDEKLTFYYMFALNSHMNIEDKCGLTSAQTKGSLLNLIDVKEVNLYFKSDSFEGILIKSEVRRQMNSVLSLETLVEPIEANTHLANHFGQRLITIQVCSEFDVKEAMFRNFGCILGPNSKPIALHKWQLSGQSLNTTFVWIDPNNKTAASYDTKIESNDFNGQTLEVSIQRPRLATPLLPGVWRLIVLHELEVIAETKFLVSPLVFINSSRVSDHSAQTLHDGSDQTQTHLAYNSNSIEKLLKQRLLMPKTGLSGDLRGDRLLDWINQLYRQFFVSPKTCYIPESTTLGPDFNCDLNLSPCHLTDWSSHSPDPKSDISTLV